MIRIKEFSINEVVELIKSRKEETIIDGFKVHLTSDRYKCFVEKGFKCVNCGLEGTFFALETTIDDQKINRAHFNLYAIKDGKEILMAKDHVIPKSKNGKDHIDNYQTMCSPCNRIKADNVKNEYILCAAIHFDDGKKYAHQPKNIENGLVFCGWRHGCIFAQIGGTVGERQSLGIYERKQGFLTNFNRFVDRKEGLKIALAAKQVKNINQIRGEQLYSEDLY
jgi:hypothetical protein